MMPSKPKADYVDLISNANRLSLLSLEELFQINPSLIKGRAPLVAHFETRNQPPTRLAVVVAHLTREAPKFRLWQAEKLNQWVQSQCQPPPITGR